MYYIIIKYKIQVANEAIQSFKQVMSFSGNYPEKCPVRIWKRDIPHRIDLLISNNFSFIRFFAQRVYYELSVVKVYDSQPIFY